MPSLPRCCCVRPSWPHAHFIRCQRASCPRQRRPSWPRAWHRARPLGSRPACAAAVVVALPSVACARRVCARGSPRAAPPCLRASWPFAVRSLRGGGAPVRGCLGRPVASPSWLGLACGPAAAGGRGPSPRTPLPSSLFAREKAREKSARRSGVSLARHRGG